MTHPILHAPIFLSIPSRPATKEDLPLAHELAETFS